MEDATPGGDVALEATNWPEGVGPELNRGDTLDQYTIIDRLGQGGMGTVYSAQDRKLERVVAIKVLRIRTSDAGSFSKMLLREARALAKLSHPNIVSVFDIGVSQEQVFLVMECITGCTLSEWLKQKPRSVDDIVGVFADAGEGLAAAHAAEVVHGDFKPSNVLVGDDGRVRVVDFGVARVEPRAGGSSGAAVSPMSPMAFDETQAMGDRSAAAAGSLLTSTPAMTVSVLAGTPAYMAPEQFSTASQDARSDQFSFCVALYEAIFGERPFGGADFTTLSRNVQLGRREALPPIPRSQRRVAKVIERGLQTQPGNRFPSMKELVRALSATRQRTRLLGLVAVVAATMVTTGVLAAFVFGGDDGPSPCTDSATQMVGVWDDTVRKNVRRAVAASGGEAGLEAWGILEPALDDYARSWVSMHHDACADTHIRGEQSAELLDLRMICLHEKRRELSIVQGLLAEATQSELPGLIEASRRLRSVAECDDLPALTAPVRPPVGEENRARERRLRDQAIGFRVLNVAGRYDETLEGVAAPIKEAGEFNHDRALSELLLERGLAERNGGLLKDAEQTLTEAAEAGERARDALAKVRAWSELVYVIGHERLVDGWQPWARLATAALKGMEGPSAAQPARDLLWAKATVLAGRYRLEEAIAMFDELETLAKRDGAQLDLARVVAAKGTALFSLGQVARGREYLARGVELRTAAFGANHPLVAEAENNLGLVYASLGETERGFELVSRAKKTREAATPPNVQEIAESYVNLGSLQFQMDKTELARASFQRALELEESVLRPDHPNLAGTLINLATANIQLERMDEARALLERAETIVVNSSGYSHFDQGAALFGLAQALAESGDEARARKLGTLARKVLSDRDERDEEGIAAIDAWLAEL